MNIRAKTQEWVNHQILTDEERQALLSYEKEKYRSFWILAFLWLGLFGIGVGLITLITDVRLSVPNWAKITIWTGMTAISIALIIYAFRNHKKIVLESVLFFVFLLIGGGIGLLAQIFDLPVHSSFGLLGWAILSLTIVLISEHELLSLLWLPLFLGGILGYIHLEFLFLFLAQAPVATTCLLATILGSCIYITRYARIPFLKAFNHWCIALFYLVLLFGETGIPHPMTAFIVTTGFLVLLTGYAIHMGQPFLFNLTVCILAIRFILLTMDMTHLSEYGAILTLLCGIIIIAATTLYRSFTNQRVSKP